jgi:hypothetical protein
VILDVLQQIFSMFQAQIVSVPLDNPLGYVYVIFNLAATVFLLLMGFDSTGGSGGLF